MLRWLDHTAGCKLRKVRADRPQAPTRRWGTAVSPIRSAVRPNLGCVAGDQSSRAPIVSQAASDIPIFRGVGDDGADLRCAECGSLLLANISPGAVFDIALRCAGCGAVAETPAWPAGRGLGGVSHLVRDDHRAAGTFLLDMDQVLVGPDAQRRRAAETGRGLPEPASILLDIAGLESLIATARLRFEPILAVVPPPRAGRLAKHRLLRLIESVEQNIQDLRAGGDTVDVRSAVRLRRAVLAFARWAEDPLSGRLMQESVQPETFDHNVELLEVASSLENAGLAPEFVVTGSAPTPDLILRVSATRLIELDVKTPRALQLPAAGQALKLLDPRQVVRRALHSSRGQFSTSGILVIAAEIWLNTIDNYAYAAAEILKTPLASGASVEAKEHYRRLLGVLFVSTGYNVDGTDVRSASFARWVPSPRYGEEISLALPSDLDGPFTITFKPSSQDISGSPWSKGEPPPGPAFRQIGSEVRAEGRIVSTATAGTSYTEAFQFPVTARPRRTWHFDLACESGFTTAKVGPDGWLMVDPRVGWVDLHGVRFDVIADEPLLEFTSA